MKKAFVILSGIFILASCSNNGGESGAVNDGFNGPGDKNGGLADTVNRSNGPAIDTAQMDNRVDTENRDTAKGNR